MLDQTMGSTGSRAEAAKEEAEGRTKSFEELAHGNPCDGCPAPCCRTQLSPYKTPATFADIDHVRFTLLFPNTELVVAETGEWSVMRWANCIFLDEKDCTCTVHGTPAKPKICVQYDAHNCWYKRNLVTDDPPEIYRLTGRRFEAWVREITFHEDGRIASVPSFERAREVVAAIPVEVEMRPGSPG